jgi:predicted phosphodiesterase
MRIAIVSDIHDNLTAFDAVLADLRKTSPDLVLHGGDLVSGGSSPAEVVDRVRDLGWLGVFGNSEEAIVRPETLEAFARQSAAPRSLWDAVHEMTVFTRGVLGEERIAWLGALPRVLLHPPVALVHASPASAWHSPLADATDAELESTYLPLGQAIAVFGQILRSFVRDMAKFTVINTGSVSQSFDGDPSASYLLMDNGTPMVRRVEYDIEREIDSITASGLRTRIGWHGRSVPRVRGRSKSGPFGTPLPDATAFGRAGQYSPWSPSISWECRDLRDGRPSSRFWMGTGWARVWSESSPVQRKRGGCGMQKQRRRRNGDAAPADLLLGFQPITEGIAVPSGLPALLENLICPLADLQVRTDADHGLSCRFG